MTLKKKIAISLLSIAALGFIALCGAYFAYTSVFKQKFNIQAPTRIYLPHQITKEELFEILYENNIPFSQAKLDFVYTSTAKNNLCKSGCYEITQSTTYLYFVRSLLFGWQKPINLTINNCRLPEQLAAKMSQQLLLDSAQIVNFLCSTDSMATINATPKEWNSIIISNTYQVWWNCTMSDLMQRFKKEYTAFWTEERLQKATNQNLTPFQVMTLASIVDEETNYEPEMPIIAGLYLNRLKKGMLLQSDPTVKYALKQFDLRRILFTHLQYDDEYNTYIYAGLPPSPICMPCMAAINAVLEPQNHDYIYMCASEKLDGTHHFAITLSEHNKNANNYHRALSNLR